MTWIVAGIVVILAFGLVWSINEERARRRYREAQRQQNDERGGPTLGAS